MGSVGLLFSGATLFLNSLFLMGKADGKSIAIFNLLIGTLQVVTPFYLIVTSDQGTWSLYNNAPIFIFGLTYLYLGIVLLTNINGNGLGWYSLWVAIVGLVYAVVYFVHSHDYVNTLTWIMWAFLWFLFFLSMALEWKIEMFIGRIAFVQSWVTLTIPALLSLTGVWNLPVVNQIWIWVSLASIVYFIIWTFQYKKIKEYDHISASIASQL
jgi:hypothetical protein